jgi:putative ABC transport system substrate-binding protein
VFWGERRQKLRCRKPKLSWQDYKTLVSKWAHGKNEILPELADALVRLNPDVLVAAPMPAVLALKALTNTIPITSFMLADEIRLGLVASDARPGGNVTGLDMRVDGLVGKQIELATRAVPGATTLEPISKFPTTVDPL